eukprot:gene25132-biopygen25988
MGGPRGEGRSRRLSSLEVNRTLDQYRRVAIWCTKTRVAAVERLLVLAHPSMPTTKDVVLEERKDMLIEFQRLEEAIVEDMPRDLEGPTDDLVEVGLLETDRRVVSGEWPLGEPGDRWERLRGVAAKERRRVMAWAAAARDMQQETRPGTRPSPNGSGSPRSSGPSPRGVLRSEEEVQRMVDAAVAAALAGRDPIGKGGGSTGRDPPVSLRDVARASVGRRRGWSLTEFERVITEIKPWEFELLDDGFAACRQEQCGLEELPKSRKVRTKHLHAYIDLALRELADMQRALAGQREERKRAAAKARFGSLRTATDEELRRALDESLAVKDITRPPEALKDWPDVAFLVRGAACGVGFPFAGKEPDEPYIVENYVGDEHAEAMTAELAKEMAAGRIFDVRDWLPRGVSALGMVERLRKGKLKYRPVWDYSRPSFVGVNDWINLQKDEFTSVKDAYALLRPGMYMEKVDLEEAYRSLPVALQYWAAQCFQWRGVRYMDTRSPFGNRALPGIFTRYTRAIVAWMHAQGVPCVGYLDDFFMVARTAAEAQEMMDLLIEFVTMSGFKVNRAKCEGPARRMEFLGVLLCIDGVRCTASIDEERVQQVTSRLREMRAEAATGPVRRRKLESLLGLLAFCAQVVWGQSLYTRQGFALVAATVGRSRMVVSTGVAQDLKVVERVIRLYNGRKVVLHKEDVHEDAFATDASLRKGMGGHCQPDYFLVSWEDLAEMPQRDF